MTPCNLVDGYQSFKKHVALLFRAREDSLYLSYCTVLYFEGDNFHDTGVFQLYLDAFTRGQIRYFFSRGCI